MLKIFLMLLVTILTIGLVTLNFGYPVNPQVLGQVTLVFLLGILGYHYFFIWFPRALNKGRSLQLAVKIIYSSVDEAIIESSLKGPLMTELNQSLRKLSAVLDKNWFTLCQFNVFKLFTRGNLEEAWRKFFLEAFTLIEEEIDDQTIQHWTYHKIMNKFNHDECSQQAKLALQPFLRDSKYFYLVEP